MEEILEYKEFNLSEYKDGVSNIKLKRFLQYLETELKMNDENCKHVLESLSKEDVIKSLKYYIAINNVGYQVTASNYITYVKKFFRRLSAQYNIKNNLFLHNELYDDMHVEAKEIIDKLSKGEIEIAEDETLEELKRHIRKEVKNIDTDIVWEEISKRSLTRNTNTGNYNNLMSIIPTKLAIEYGLKNECIHALEIGDYDPIDNKITIKDFMIPLSDEYRDLFDIYLKMREFLMRKYKYNYKDLFIKGTGEPVTNEKGKPDTNALFFVMKKALGTCGTKQFVYKKIIDYIDKGFDISTISIVTGVSPSTCTKLLMYYNTEVTKVNINKIFKELSKNSGDNDIENIENTEQESIKNYMRCPWCGDFVKSDSDNWVVIQYGDDEETYIACKGCKGVNEKDYM